MFLLLWGQKIDLLVGFVIETSRIAHCADAPVPTLVDKLKELLLVGCEIRRVYEYPPESIDVFVLDSDSVVAAQDHELE